MTEKPTEIITDNMEDRDDDTEVVVSDGTQLSLKSFLSSIPNIDRACSTVIENSTAIFLPHKRLDMSLAQAKFMENNQTLEVSSDLFDKVEVQGRLLCQTHKDILEVLLTSKKSYNKSDCAFSVKTTAYQILKRLKKSTSNKKWLSTKLDEISQCRIKITSEGSDGSKYTVNFGIIEKILGRDDKEYVIKFAPSYTHYMAEHEMLDYHKHVDDILSIESPFIRSIVRYMLTHKGNNSQIRIENLVEKIGLKALVSEEQLKDDLTDLRRPETQEMLRERFGITLTNSEKTITYNSGEKQRYIIQPDLFGSAFE